MIVYTCIDSRKVADPLTGLVLMVPVPGGFEIWQHEGYSESIEFDDDADLENTGNVVTFRMTEGAIDFVPLTLMDFERHKGYERYNVDAKFKSDDDLQTFWRTRIENL